MKFYYVVLPEMQAQHAALTLLGVKDRLLSFALLPPHWRDKELRRYVRTGLPPELKNRRAAEEWLNRPIRQILLQRADQLRHRRLAHQQR